MLLQYGMGVQPVTWHVSQPKAAMYSRVYWIWGGNTRYQSEFQQLTLKKNRLYFFPEYTPYEISTDPRDPLECLHLHLDLQAVSFSSPVSLDLEQDPEMLHLMQVFGDAMKEQRSAEYLELLSQALVRLCQERQLFSRPDPRVRHLIALLRENIRGSCSIARLAAGEGYSTEHFIRIFRQSLGVSPRQFLISLRMSEAVHLLSQDLAMAEIAQAVGYADERSFSNAFSGYYGMPPGQYRRLFVGYA